MTGPSRRAVLTAAAVAAAGTTAHGATPGIDGRRALAPTPPMGWNSWNSFAVTITEAEARGTADIMARVLKPAGYDVFTIDHQRYDPRTKGFTYNSDIVPVMDGYGRFQPDPVRFPSSAQGRRLASLARFVHDRGLRFGIHRMRGTPRAAVQANLPVEGTRWRARDIADMPGLAGEVAVRDRWARRVDRRATGRLARSLPSHGCGLDRVSRA